MYLFTTQTSKTMGIQVKTIKQSHKNNPLEDMKEKQKKLG
jgi:hypothetical protein